MNRIPFPVNEKMPDPLCKPDGSRIKSHTEWAEQRAYLLRLVDEWMYGKWPSADEPAQWELLLSVKENGLIREERRIHYRCKGKAFKMDVCVVRPDDNDTHPVAVNCDISVSLKKFIDTLSPEIREKLLNQKNPKADYNKYVTKRGFAIAEMSCHMLIPDRSMPFGEQEEVYPETECGTIMTWAWGYTLVADCLMREHWAGQLICIGCSRYGKAALCAGIHDTRYIICAPVASGCGGAGAYRYLGTANGSRQDSVECETSGAVSDRFPDWFTENFNQFGCRKSPYPLENENRMPYDSNILRALVAPRAVITSDGIEDNWSNPYGTQLGWLAAQPVFNLLSVPENNIYHVRPYGHAIDDNDWVAVLDFCDWRLYGRQPAEPLNTPVFNIEEMKSLY